MKVIVPCCGSSSRFPGQPLKWTLPAHDGRPMLCLAIDGLQCSLDDLVVTVLPDARFERRGDDLYTRVVAPLATLLLGGEARVPTPDGRRLALTIPAGTQDGRVFRLRGQGMPHLAQPDRRGDLHAEVHARLPEQVSPRQRELLEEFVHAGGEAPVGGAV